MDAHPATASRLGDPRVVHLPAVDESVADEVWAHVLRMRSALPKVGVTASNHHAALVLKVPRHGEVFGMAVALVETLLEKAAEEVTAEMHAEIAFLALVPGVPEQIALQVAFGSGVGERNARKFARLITQARLVGRSVDEHVAELAASDAIPRDDLVRLFLGEERQPPSLDRIGPGIAIFRRTASLVPESLRPPLLCVIAWLQWAHGRRPVAMAYLAETSRIEPHNVLARGLRAHFLAAVPKWLEPESG